MRNAFLFLLSIFVLISCKTQKENVSKSVVQPANTENALLWEISGNGMKTPSYILGTFHLMCKEDIVFTPGVEAGIKQADRVYFEVDLSDPMTLLGSLKVMNMEGNQTIKSLLSTAEYDKVNRFFKDSLGMGIQMFDRYKPMFVQSMMYTKMMNCEKMSGVEEELMKIAKKNNKKTFGFETIEEQASFFDSIPYKTQAKALYQSVDSFQKSKNEFAVMYELYKKQDLSKLAVMMDGSDDAISGNLDMLLYNRNENWVKQLKSILPTNSVFIAVGAGHLPGERGVLNLLKKEGYVVRAVR